MKKVQYPLFRSCRSGHHHGTASRTTHRYPHLLLDTGCQATQVTVDKPGSGACHPRRALRGNLLLRTPLGPRRHTGNDSVKGDGRQLCPVMTRPLTWQNIAAVRGQLCEAETPKTNTPC